MNALILTGSPKGRKSASFLLASTLGERLRENGVTVSDGLVHAALRTEEGTLRMLDAVDGSDLVVLAFPLYVDSLPAPLTRLLERVAGRSTRVASPKAPRLAVIVQCGFPEAHQCDTAVGICRLFAERAGMQWAGALSMGMGGSIGEDIRRLPGGGKNILDALKMTAESLADGGDVPAVAAALFARPLMSRRLYTMMGNLGWRMQMRKNRARRPLTYRPYPQE
jgi:multimeric flavodoxin WrbA